MGKKGDLLRALKRQQATYTFTGEELEEHDRQVRKAWSESREEAFKKKAYEQIQAYKDEVLGAIDSRWDERSRQFKEGGTEETMGRCVSYVLALSCRVLIEQFGWKPPNTRGRNTKIMKYARALTEEIGEISQDMEMDIVQYAKETEKKYNLSFLPEDAEDAS